MAAPDNLSDLEEDCLLSILAKVSPADVARSALVCRKLFKVSKSVEPLLPPNYEHLLRLASDENVRNLCGAKTVSDRQNIYNLLASQIFIRDGKGIFFLDRSTGGMCYMLSSKALAIVWMDDPRYWEWRTHAKSRFHEVAYLRNVCWLEVVGSLECFLHPGYYTVSFRMQVKRENYGLSSGLAKFSLSTSDGQHKESHCRIKQPAPEESLQPLAATRLIDEVWTEYDIGDFLVTDAIDPITIHFSMTELGGHWKSGLIVDCVVIRPNYLIPHTSTQRVDWSSSVEFDSDEEDVHEEDGVDWVESDFEEEDVGHEDGVELVESDFEEDDVGEEDVH